MPARSSGASAISYCRLNGAACQVMSPRRTAASNAATAVAFGQRTPMSGGHERKSEASQLCVR